MTNLFKGESSKIRKGEKPSPYAIEFMCAAERALAFAVGGNPRVLSRGVMHPLFISRGIIDQGMPTFKQIYGQSVTVSASDPLFFKENQWPLAKDMKYPAIASKRGQILTYGEPHYLVSTLISFPLSPGLWRVDMLFPYESMRLQYPNCTHSHRILIPYNDECPPR
jgi:hypothetical protein